ncbi:hypothetical protein PL373_05960 [Tenacibaculum maritimum]|nr:hypothetical protein [Tenacibaculum maritimum]MDB0600695.1 hypothetical protein [Tenacibaculum maritimum]MDB0612678.1 hypothetical protein [Tenacibaculum maritimum]
MATNKAKEIAIEVLKSNSYIDQVHVTSDNKPFSVISDAQNYAAKKFDDAESRKIKSFTREELRIVANTKKELKVSVLVKNIKAAATIKEVDSLIQNEFRPFVLKIAEARVKELSPPELEIQKNIDDVNDLQQKNAVLKTDLDKASKDIITKDKALKSKDAAIKAKDIVIKELQEAAALADGEPKK